MILHDVIAEEQVEPVGITELCLLQVGVHGSIGIGQPILSVGLVILGDEVVHLTIQTSGGAVGKCRELKPTLGGHFFVDTHLLLRVRDVVVPVAGLQTIGKLTGIVNG